MSLQLFTTVAYGATGAFIMGLILSVNYLDGRPPLERLDFVNVASRKDSLAIESTHALYEQLALTEFLTDTR